MSQNNSGGAPIITAIICRRMDLGLFGTNGHPDGPKKMYGNHFELCWSKQKHQREIADIAWAGAFGHNKIDDGSNQNSSNNESH